MVRACAARALHVEASADVTRLSALVAVGRSWLRSSRVASSGLRRRASGVYCVPAPELGLAEAPASAYYRRDPMPPIHDESSTRGLVIQRCPTSCLTLLGDRPAVQHSSRRFLVIPRRREKFFQDLVLQVGRSWLDIAGESHQPIPLVRGASFLPS